MQVLHILRNPTLTSHSHNSSEGISSQDLEIQRGDQENSQRNNESVLFCTSFCSVEQQWHSPGRGSWICLWTWLDMCRTNTVCNFRWSLRTLRVLVYLMNPRCKINLQLYCHRIITLPSCLDIAHNMHNRVLYLLLQLLVQIDFLGCPSHFTEAFKKPVLSSQNNPL